MPLLQLPNGRWRVQIRRKGLPAFDKVFATLDEASRAHEQQLALPSQGFVPVDLTLRELWRRYEGSVEFRQKAEHTRRTETVRIKPVLAALGDYALKHLEASPLLMYDYIDQRSQTVSRRTGRPLSPTSIRLEIAALSATCIWAKRRRLIAENFVRFISRPGIAQRKRRLGKVELSALADHADHANASIAQAARFVRLLRLLGCRPGELAALGCDDLDLHETQVTFRGTKHKKEDRTVHLTPAAVQTLSEQVLHYNERTPGAPYLFATPTRWDPGRSGGTTWRPYNYPWGIALLRKHGVVGRDFHAHAARREFVSRAIEDGVDYATIRKQTGHHSTAAIEIYDRGLSTAPELRARLDRHAATVADDELAGLIERMGLSREDLQRIMGRVKGKQSGIAIEHPQPRARPRRHAEQTAAPPARSAKAR